MFPILESPSTQQKLLLHDDDDAREHLSGYRCAESSVPSKQSWSNGRITSPNKEPTSASPAISPSPTVYRLKGEGSSSHKKLEGVKNKSTKQPSKPKPQALIKKENLASNLQPIASSDWWSEAAIEKDDLSTKPQLLTKQVYRSKNLISELNEKFFSLRAMVPRKTKIDKASIVVDAIDYVKDLHKQLKTTQDDILAIQDGTYVPAQKGLSTHNNKGVDAQLHKQVNTPQHKIVEMHVLNMEPKIIYFSVHCKRRHGVLLQLTKALEGLNLKIFSANLATFNDLVINTIIIKANEVLKGEDFKELLEKSFPMYGLHF